MKQGCTLLLALELAHLSHATDNTVQIELRVLSLNL